MTITEKRIELGLTQKEFSELLGIPLYTIQGWDRGARVPPFWVKELIFFKIEYMQRHGML